MIVYKWTSAGHQTHASTQWGAGVSHAAPGGGELCTERWIHGYSSAALAVLMRTVHVPHYYVLWQCEGDVGRDDGTKLGMTRCTTVRIIDAPVLTPEQHIAWGILAAAQVPQSAEWLQWARNWLTGDDRTPQAAEETAGGARAGCSASWAAAAAARAARAAGAAEAAAARAVWSVRSWSAAAAEAAGSAVWSAVWSAARAAEAAGSAGSAEAAARAARADIRAFAARVPWIVEYIANEFDHNGELT